MARTERTAEVDALGHMAEVLVAEAHVRQQVEACKDDLNQQISAQQEWARALQRRIHARLTRLHGNCDRSIQTRITELRDLGGKAGPSLELDAADLQSLQSSVEQLADLLIGRGHG